MKIPRKILFVLSAPLELVPRPYAAPAAQAGLTEKALLQKIKAYKKAGLIRRVGVVLGHFKAGYKCNALVAWKIDPAVLELTGNILAGFAQVTHCYARRTFPQWPYNLYTMVHARDKKEVQALIRDMARKSGIKEYKVQTTLREFKKVKSNLKEILA
ncbi:MAG: Lrp/AsnC family transcriptional regulator [Candidatus Omnitrophica bacterium]|nr:Lrp/AsnC family transcriptional regulator [Candidatus Omnitrophota bacterium]